MYMTIIFYIFKRPKRLSLNKFLIMYNVHQFSKLSELGNSGNPVQGSSGSLLYKLGNLILYLKKKIIFSLEIVYFLFIFGFSTSKNGEVHIFKKIQYDIQEILYILHRNQIWHSGDMIYSTQS